MQRFVLERPVTIDGRDFIGRPASVTLMPTETPGWFWHLEDRDVLITPQLLRSKKRRVVLDYYGYRLNIFEHLGPLRFMGLDNVSIHPETTWLPYDGSARLFMDACVKIMRPAGTLKPYTLRQTVSAGNIETGNVFVQYAPGSTKSLRVKIYIDYPGFGKTTIWPEFPGADLERILSTKTQGWPRWFKPLAWLWSSQAVPQPWRWPHYNNVVWPRAMQQDGWDDLRSFARHRVLDVLGTLSVLCPPGGILVGDVYSHCAGHRQDILLAKQAASLLLPVKETPVLEVEQ